MKDPVALSVVTEQTDSVSFMAQIVKHVTNPYSLWIELDGFDDQGVNVGRVEQGLSNWQSDTATATLSKPIGVTFTAYVWLFPDFTRPVSNVLAL